MLKSASEQMEEHGDDLLLDIQNFTDRHIVGHIYICLSAYAVVHTVSHTTTQFTALYIRMRMCNFRLRTVPTLIVTCVSFSTMTKYCRLKR
jgi:hypothetical protein